MKKTAKKIIIVAIPLIIGIATIICLPSVSPWISEPPPVATIATKESQPKTPDKIHKELSIKGKTINVIGDIIDTQSSVIEILTPDTLRSDTSSEQYSGLTLQEYAALGHFDTVYSGGYLSSWSPPLPLGFVKVNGEILNRAHDTYLTRGLLCVANGKITITVDDPAQTEEWSSCLQVGTPLVRNGEITIDKSRESWYVTNQPVIQAFICEMNSTDFVIAMTKEEVSLDDLVKYLVLPEDQGGLGCVNAIGRAGHKTAGMITHDNGTIEEYGNVNILLPNAIALDKQGMNHDKSP